jgi:hypothetical protein
MYFQDKKIQFCYVINRIYNECNPLNENINTLYSNSALYLIVKLVL